MCRQVCSVIPCNIFGTRMCKFYSVLSIKFRVLKCITQLQKVPYILESNPHPNLIRTQFLAIS